MVIGQKYFISFRTVMGEDFISGYQFGMPSNNIGLRLSTIEYDPSSSVPTDNFAHLYSASVISDSNNWQQISGSLIADSAYQFAIIGNFFDDANTDTVHYNCDSCINAESYYLIDDICVSTDSLLCNGGIDVIPCVAAISEIDNIDKISIYPNATSDFLTILFSEKLDAYIAIYDIYGNQLYQYKLQEKLNPIDISSYQNGTYIIKILTENNIYYVNKVVKL